jgi:hypothetical protein
MRASPAVKFVQNAPFRMQRAAMAATKITVHIGGSALDYQEPSTPSAIPTAARAGGNRLYIYASPALGGIARFCRCPRCG